MLGWLPIIGPLLDGVFSIFRKQQDIALERIKDDTERVRIQAQLVRDFKDDIGVRLTRDIVIFPVGVWTALVSWDTIMAIRFPNLMFHVEKYPPVLEYLPYAVLTFLLGNVWMNKRK
jgi:hypothetical protein